MCDADLNIVPAVIPVLPAVHSLLVLVLLVGSALLAGVWALRHPRSWGTLLKFVWSQKWSLLSLVAVLYLAGVLIGRAGGGRDVPIDDAPPVLSNGYWPARGNQRRSGSTTNASVPSSGAIRWVGGNGLTFYSSPAVIGERVYGLGFSGDRSRIFCWDAHDGRQLWTRSSDGLRATFSSPVIDGTRLIVGEGLHHTSDASLFLFDISDGRNCELLARFPTNSHIEGTAVVADGYVYFTAGDDGVYSWDVRGSGVPPLDRVESSRSLPLCWHVPGEQIPDAETAICRHDGKLFVGSGVGGEALIVLDAQTGKEAKRIALPYPVHGLPSIVDEQMYVGMGTADYVNYDSSTGQLSCIDLKSLSECWSLSLEGTLLGAAACDEAGIVFGCTDGQVYAVDHDGSVQATWNSRAPILASVALAGQTVVVVNQAGMLYALRRDDLQPIWQVRLGEPGAFLSGPVVAHDRIYVGTPTGFLCIGESTNEGGTVCSDETLPDAGAVLWRYRFDDRITASPGVTDSTIVVAGQAGNGPVLTGLRRGADGPSDAVWSRSLDASVVHPIVTTGEIAVVSLPDELLALDAPTGTMLWRCSAATESAPVVDSDRIWIDVGNSSWRAIALTDGQPTSDAAADHSSLEESDGITWHVDGGVLCIERSGEAARREWCDLSAIGRIVRAPTAADGRVFVVLDSGELVALGRAEEQ